MGVRNILILFFATMAVALIVLTAIFYLLFEKVDLTFETKLPESAPTVEYNAPPDEDTEIDEDDEAQLNEDSSPSAEESPDSETVEEAAPGSDEKKKDEKAVASPRQRQERLQKPRAFRPSTSGFRAKGLAHAVVRVPGGEAYLAPVSTEDSEPVKAEPAQVASAQSPADTDALPVMTQVKKAGMPPSPKVASTVEPSAPNPPVPSGNSAAISSALKPPAASSQVTGALYQVYIDGFGSDEAAQARLDTIRSGGGEAFLSRGSGRPVIKLGTFSNKATAQGIAAQHGAKVREIQ